MPHTRSEQDTDRIRDDVQARLTSRADQLGFQLNVVEVFTDGDDWLHLVVVPDGENVRAYDYAKTLTEIEQELRDEGTREVLLVPARSD